MCVCDYWKGWSDLIIFQLYWSCSRIHCIALHCIACGVWRAVLSRIQLLDKNAFWIKSVALDRFSFLHIMLRVWHVMCDVWCTLSGLIFEQKGLQISNFWKKSGFRLSPKFGAEFGNYTGKPRFRMKIRRRGLVLILRICIDHDICNLWNSHSKFMIKNSNLSQFPFKSEIVGRFIKLYFENLKYLVIFSIEIRTMTPETNTKNRICAEMIWQHFVTFCETCKIAWLCGCGWIISWKRYLCWHER